MDSKGQSEPRKKKIRVYRRGGRTRTLLEAAQREGADNPGFQFHEAVDTAIVKMNVINSLKV